MSGIWTAGRRGGRPNRSSEVVRPERPFGSPSIMSAASRVLVKEEARQPDGNRSRVREGGYRTCHAVLQDPPPIGSGLGDGRGSVGRGGVGGRGERVRERGDRDRTPFTRLVHD